MHNQNDNCQTTISFHMVIACRNCSESIKGKPNNKMVLSFRRKNDTVVGEMDVFPIGNEGRWGQTIITPNNEVCIFVHTVEDALVALERLPYDMEPHTVKFCVPADIARRVWGIPPLDSFKPLFHMISKESLKEIFIWMASPCQLIGALPSSLENVDVWVCPCDNHEEKLWGKFFDYTFRQPMFRLAICHVYIHGNLAHTGCLKALYHSPWASAQFREFRIIEGTISFEDAKSFYQNVVKRHGISFKFDCTVVTEVGSIDELAKLMEGNYFIAATIEPSKDLAYTENECNNAIASKWGSTETTEGTTKIYSRILAATTSLDHADYELPQSRSEETVKNLCGIVDRIVRHFKTLPSKHTLVKLHMRVRVPGVKEHLNEREKAGFFKVKWSQDEYAEIAELSLQVEPQEGHSGTKWLPTAKRPR